MNPGSLVGDNVAEDVWDISVRRYRFGVKGRLTEKIDYALVIGNNNFNTRESSLEITLLELYFKYQISEWMALSGGKSIWSGLSRFGGPSASSSLGLDVSFASNPYLNNHDQRFRKFSVVLHGLLDRVQYRWILAKPNFQDDIGELSQEAILFNDPQNVHTAGYFAYNFLEREEAVSAPVGTHYGKKNLLNLGLGFSSESRASAYLDSEGETQVHRSFSYAMDLFYEGRLRNRQTLTLYGAYFKHDIGPNFVRFVGVNSIATGSNEDVSLNGPGNSFAASGTGDILLFKAGYYREFSDRTGVVRGIQPYAQYQYSDLEGLNEASHLLEVGLHYLIRGNASRLTLGLQNWSVFDPVTRVSDQRRNMLVLMYQIKF